MARSHATLIFATALVINVLLLSQSKLTNIAVQRHDGQDFNAGVSLLRKGFFVTESEGSGENVRPRPGSISNLSFTEPSTRSRPPGFVSDTGSVDIISADPPCCPLRINVPM
jgi:hypothetical protein